MSEQEWWKKRRSVESGKDSSTDSHVKRQGSCHSVPSQYLSYSNACRRPMLLVNVKLPRSVS